MNLKLRSLVSTAVAVAVILAALAGVAYADTGTVVATGFNGPMGILVAPDGSIWVIDSGVGGDKEMTMKNPETGEDVTVTMGDTARIVQIAADGTQTVAATLPSLNLGMEVSGGSRLALLNGVVYATSGGWSQMPEMPAPPPNMAAIVKVENGKAVEVAQPWKLELDKNPGGFVVDSHPYGLIGGPDGNLWLADAGGNDLLKVNPTTGQVDLVTVFPGIPGPMPNPERGGANESDPVPTAVAVGKDGGVYVSLLPGAPFLPGSAKVVRVAADGTQSDYATGLAMLTDLRLGPDDNLYGVSFGQFTEQGPVPNAGAILRVKPGSGSEVVVSGLSFPTSIDFNAAGDAYVTINGVGAPGSGQVVLYKGLTGMAGSALPPPSLPTTGGNVLSVSGAWALLVLGLGLAVTGLVLRKRGDAPVEAR